MIERPFFLPNNGSSLFAILHEPQSEPNGIAFAFCHPFVEEKLWAHRVMVNFARKLALSGYTVLRFDFRGHGDSGGSFAESTIETRLSDIETAIDWLREERPDCRQFGLLGLRFGATLACLASERCKDISSLILWEPILSGPKYMKELLRINMTTQTAVFKEIRYNTKALVDQMKNGGVVNVEGYEISWPLYAEMLSIDLLYEQKKFEGKTLIVQINRREGAGTKRMQPLADLYQHGLVAEVVEDLFWKEIRHYYPKALNLSACTFEWLEKNERT